MGAKKLYAMYADGTKVGEYSSREIAGLLKIRQEIVSNYSDTGLLYKGRFLFDTVCEGVGKTRKEPLLKEWDEVRLRILTVGR
ncbi:MAG: hypothetical protein QM657_18380 [Lacrimispora sp.]|uniref:hypothetical protein n=1 Tax=Lacrimispora sp. TaxID=2719234 RepID=UPI0039E2E436